MVVLVVDSAVAVSVALMWLNSVQNSHKIGDEFHTEIQ